MIIWAISKYTLHLTGECEEMYLCFLSLEYLSLNILSLIGPTQMTIIILLYLGLFLSRGHRPQFSLILFSHREIFKNCGRL